MITLPLYIIEHCNGKWHLYDTVNCITLIFETKIEAETKLKEICK